MDKNITKLITQSAIRNVVIGLGATITHDYRKRDLTVVCLLDGSLVFTANLLLQYPQLPDQNHFGSQVEQIRLEHCLFPHSKKASGSQDLL
jgi:hypoxanthine-guanine phosphoribosyltransferase